MDRRVYESVKKRLGSLLGMDLDAYRETQVQRRLEGYLLQAGIPSPFHLCRLLEQDLQARRHLRDYLTVNVSEFFRDPEAWETLRARVLPALLEDRRSLTLWSAGCSHGAEPYSLAILLEQAAPGVRCQILATDVDEEVLERARAGGPYREEEVRQVPGHLLRRYFVPSPQGFWVVPALRKRVRFQHHDLLMEEPPGQFDLVLCRYVAIYFLPQARDRVYRRLANALRPGGWLFLGTTEVVLDPRTLGLQHLFPCLYRKTGDGRYP